MRLAWPLALGLGLAAVLTSPTLAQDALPGAARAEGSGAPAPDPLLERLVETTASFAGDHRAALDLQTGQLTEEESAYYDLEVEAGACYTFVAVGDDALADLDLHVYAGGVEVASDTAVDNTPLVHWCNRGLPQVSAELRAYSGAGRFLFEVLARDAAPEGVAGTLRARLDALTGRFAEGFRPALTPVTGVLANGEEARYELILAGGRAYVIVGTGVATVDDLDLVLLDRQGLTELDADLERDAEPILRYEVPEDAGGRYVLRVVMAGGYGEFLVGVLSD